MTGEIDAREGFGQSASGGNGGRGSGGTIRLSAATITGDGTLRGGTNGRLRIEAFDSTYTGAVDVAVSTAPPITQATDDLDEGRLVIMLACYYTVVLLLPFLNFRLAHNKSCCSSFISILFMIRLRRSSGFSA